MTQNKTGYEAPTLTIFELRVQKGILVGSEVPNSANSGYDDLFDLGTL